MNVIKLIIIAGFIISYSINGFSRGIGETEITTDDGIEVFQNEKYYLLKKKRNNFIRRFQNNFG